MVAQDHDVVVAEFAHQLRALVDMGMPAERVRLVSRSDSRATANEVQVFVR